MEAQDRLIVSVRKVVQDAQFEPFEIMATYEKNLPPKMPAPEVLKLFSKIEASLEDEVMIAIDKHLEGAGK